MSSIQFENCAAENYFYDCCEGNQSEGRVRGVAWVKRGVWQPAGVFNATSIHQNSVWQGIVNTNLGFVIPQVRGQYDGSASVEGAGYGSQSLRLIGRNHQVTYSHLFTWAGVNNPNFEHNVDFYSWLNKQSDYEFYFVTEHHIWRTERPAMSFTQIPVSEDMATTLEFVVTVKWSNINLPTPYLKCSGSECLYVFENCDYLNPDSPCWEPVAVSSNNCSS